MKRIVEIVDQQIDTQGLEDQVWDPTCGGEVRFVGRVRNKNLNKPVESREFSAYPEMAEKELHKIIDEAAEQWPIVSCAVSHRIGRLDIGDVAVAIYVGTVHRKEAFLACRYIIDTLKEKVPIWKKERYEDGEEWIGWQCNH